MSLLYELFDGHMLTHISSCLMRKMDDAIILDPRVLQCCTSLVSFKHINYDIDMCQ